MSNVVSPEFVAEAQEIVDALNRDLIAVEDENRKGVDEVDPRQNQYTLSKCPLAQGHLRYVWARRGSSPRPRYGERPRWNATWKVAMDERALDVLFSCVDRFGVLINEASQGILGDGSGSKALLDQLKQVVEGEANTSSDDPLDSLELDDEVLGVLTEYEEHRLR